MIVIRTIIEAAKCLAFLAGLLVFGLSVIAVGLLVSRYLGFTEPASSLIAIAAPLIIGSLVAGYSVAKDDLNG